MSDRNRTPNDSNDPDNFFVGYIPMPDALKKFYLPLAVVLIAAAGITGFLWASAQKSAGPAHWHTGAPVEMEGIVTAKPYPALQRFNARGEPESVLLVSQGKYSADAAARAFDGQAVTVRGVEIQRGRWLMLEIGADAFRKSDAISAAAARQLADFVTVRQLEPVTLRGEIADSKCFLGVMKPGRGHIHKACAEVCLRGGIPPMLVVSDPGRQKFGYLLTGPTGNAAQMLAEYAGELVEITGNAHLHGDLTYITVAKDGVRPL